MLAANPDGFSPSGFFYARLAGRLEQHDKQTHGLELTANDLEIDKSNSAIPRFSVKRICANAELESLLRLVPVIDSVAVVKRSCVVRVDKVKLLDKPGIHLLGFQWLSCIAAWV